MRRSVADLAIIVAVAAAANFIYFLCSNGDYFYPDSFTYLAPAKMLLTGHGFATKPGVPEVLRTPGYPLLLALFGPRAVPVRQAPSLVADERHRRVPGLGPAVGP